MSLFKRSPGFTMVEIAVVSVLLAITYSAFMAIFVNFYINDQINNTKLGIAAIQKAIDEYVTHYGYLPCPASKFAAPNSSSYGLATDCAAAAPAGTIDYGSGSVAIRLGAVPFKALNLPQAAALDSWNNRYTYVAVKILATTATSFSGNSPSAAITIMDAIGNVIVTSGGTAYVIISHGPDGKGASNSLGNITIACNTAPGLDLVNCSNTNSFRLAPYNEGKSTNHFDDFIAWKTRAQLIVDNNLTLTP